MRCNESENVNFSDRSYEAKMTRYISYEMRGKSEKSDLGIKEWYKNLERFRHTISHRQM